LWYTLGYIGKIDWLLRIEKKMGIKGDIMARMEIAMRKHATRILFLAKLTLSLMIPALIAAGLVKAPWKRWFPAIFSGEMIWTGSLVVIGYYATEAIKRVEMGVEYVALAGTVAFVLFLIIMGRRIVKQRYESDLNSAGKD
jgi:membrane protein DedA with SNARE-associated domain